MKPSFLRLLKPAGEATVPVPEALCAELGFERIVARPGLEAGATVLLAELKIERCGHSWRDALVDVDAQDIAGLMKAVEVAAAAARPTTLFSYWGQGDGKEAPIAVAALSSHVSNGFPHPGFPVIARCFVRRCYRGEGLYPHLLRHRLDLCHSLWGEELRAVHIGAADPAVLATLSRKTPEGVSFACVGSERLWVAGESFSVPDFLGATPRFRQDLAQELRDSDLKIAVLAQKVEAFLTQGASVVSYGALKRAIQSAKSKHGKAWWQGCGNLRALVDLCDAIGIHAQ
jgi:hypothetical protein